MKTSLKLITLTILLTLAGCSDDGITESSFYQSQLPDELKDCKVYNGSLTIVRCPNSTTATHYRKGKRHEDVILIDDREYEKVEVPKQEDTALINGKLYKVVGDSK